MTAILQADYRLTFSATKVDIQYQACQITFIIVFLEGTVTNLAI